MKIRKILIMLIIIINISFVFNFNIVQAALQSSGDTPATKDRNTWITQSRNMEALGGGFGLTESINADLTSNSGTNNIDIHMQKNTEYGAMALLSASAYGNPNKIENGGTTTGNKTGIVIPYNYEWTAAQYPTMLGETSYANRYINYYDCKTNPEKSGDALVETMGWHSSVSDYYNDVAPFDSSYYKKPGGIVRNVNNGIFSFNNALRMYAWSNGTWYYISYTSGSYVGNNSTAQISNAYTSRAVIINGEGI